MNDILSDSLDEVLKKIYMISTTTEKAETKRNKIIQVIETVMYSIGIEDKIWNFKVATYLYVVSPTVLNSWDALSMWIHQRKLIVSEFINPKLKRKRQMISQLVYDCIHCNPSIGIGIGIIANIIASFIHTHINLMEINGDNMRKHRIKNKLKRVHWFIDRNINNILNDGDNEYDIPWPADNICDNIFNEYDIPADNITIELDKKYDNKLIRKDLKNIEIEINEIKVNNTQILKKINDITHIIKNISKDKSYENESDMKLQNDKFNNKLLINKEVKLWLCNTVKLPEYLDLFMSHSIDNMDIVRLLTCDNLKAMGIHKIGHQIKLLSKIKLLS